MSTLTPGESTDLINSNNNKSSIGKDYDTTNKVDGILGKKSDSYIAMADFGRDYDSNISGINNLIKSGVLEDMKAQEDFEDLLVRDTIAIMNENIKKYQEKDKELRSLLSEYYNGSVIQNIINTKVGKEVIEEEFKKIFGHLIHIDSDITKRLEELEKERIKIINGESNDKEMDSIYWFLKTIILNSKIIED